MSMALRMMVFRNNLVFDYCRVRSVRIRSRADKEVQVVPIASVALLILLDSFNSLTVILPALRYFIEVYDQCIHRENC
jgi:hypothetical protein